MKLEELNEIKNEIFNKYVENKDNIIEELNKEIEKIICDIDKNIKEEDIVDE